jgi:signal transduction histidine kinase/CheY-like chemotaxis protein
VGSRTTPPSPMPIGPPAAPLAEAARALVDNLPCGWLRLSRQGQVIDASIESARLVGRPVAELVGRPLDELLTLPSRVVYQTHLLPLLQFSGDTAELSLVLKAHGDVPPLDVLVYTRRGSEEHIEMLLAPIRQRRRIEDELVRVKRAADQAPMMVFQLVCEGAQPLRFPYASQSVRELYGCTPEEAGAAAEFVFGQLASTERGRVLQTLAAAESGRGSCHVQFSVAARRGDAEAGPRTHELVATPRRLAQGQTLWHGYIADITGRLRLEQQAAERVAAEQSARMRKEFLARASHELRTPLNAILGFAQLLGKDAEEALRPDQRQALAVLLSSGRHMLALVNRLLDLSRIESQALAPALQPLPLRAELEAAAQALQGQARARGLHVQLPDPVHDVQVMAEPLALRQLLTNLVSNAVKYNRLGGRVELGWQCCGAQRVQVWVADSGQGLDEQQRLHLFEPFNRLGAERGGTEGSGLGLVLSRQLAQSLGGDIHVDSSPGVGSRFSFELALATGTAPLQAIASLAPADTSAAAPARGTVLYVEDNEVNVLLMQAIVALRPGLELLVATHGAEAEHLCSSPGQPLPDLLLLDLNLPDTNGHELLVRLRACDGLAAVPALLVTAASEEEELRQPPPGQRGFDGCWVKPLDVDATLTAFDRLLG